MHYQWKYFLDLNNRRSSNGFGINPISYSDIYSYFRLIGYTPEEWELSLLDALDNTFLEVYHEQQEKHKSKK